MKRFFQENNFLGKKSFPNNIISSRCQMMIMTKIMKGMIKIFFMTISFDDNYDNDNYVLYNIIY